MIKITGRRNIIYIIQLIVWSNTRVLVKIFLSLFYDFKKSSLFTLLMFFGEFISGLIVYKYQSKYLRNNDKENLIVKNMRKLDKTFDKEYYKNNKFKTFILLFFATFFDFVEFMITTYYLSNFKYISASLDSRCYSFLVICIALSYRYILKFRIARHQLFSLIIIFVCFLLTIGTEYAFQKVNIFFKYEEFTMALILIFIEYSYLTLLDIIDKYLLEYGSVDPFLIIMVEGFIGCIFGTIFFFVENPIEDLKNIYNSNSTTSFAFFIVLLFLYFLFTTFRVAFRIMVNKMFSPMVLTLSDYFLNPLYLIYNYIFGDFKSKDGDQNPLYFSMNLILSTLTAISTFIYNEFVVLFCCGLEHNTHYQISQRSKTEEIEMNVYEIQKDLEKGEEEEDIDDDDCKRKVGTYTVYVNDDN